MEMADVAVNVIDIIRKKLPASRQSQEITVDSNLQELGLESIDALEMVFDLEERFDIQIPYNANSAAEDFATVGDVVRAIQGLVEQKA